MSETTWYRPGLIFWSPFSGYEVICRSFSRQLTVTGEVLSESRELKAEFATHGSEYAYTDPDGVTQMASDIRGHFLDLDTQAEQKGWTDEERETVARKLLMEIVVKFPGECRLHTKAPAVKPWPKYDDTPYASVAAFADQLGLVAEALLYEKENKVRKSVVADLEALLTAPVEDETVEELAAA